MALLLFVVFGFIVGLLARAITPGDQKMGFLMTAVLGIAGSFVGGFLTSLITSERVMDFNTSGIIGSVIGAIVVLFVAGMATRKRALL
jgi:uncharacterized membrane protein YeaQ/YmgE (transglycosylase-associated protein family)